MSADTTSPDELSERLVDADGGALPDGRAGTVASMDLSAAFAELARISLWDTPLTEVLGRVAVTQRGHARRNPAALMQKPMTMDDYLGSRMVADPLRLFDCCLETDAAMAMVLTSAERAADRGHVDLRTAELEAGAPGDDEEPSEAGERDDHLVRHRLLQPGMRLGVPQPLERQDGDRRLVG